MNDEELARILRQETAKLRLARLERLVVASLGMDREYEDFFKSVPPSGAFTDTYDCLLEVKSLDADVGVVSGYLSTFGNEDLGHDVIERGAFAKTLVEARTFAEKHRSPALLPLLWQHQKDEPIGGITEAREDSHGLMIQARCNLAIEKGRQAFDGLTNGYLSFSIGYRPVRYEWQGKVRHLYEIRLMEGSAVTFPMNLEARATPYGRAA